MLGRRTVSNCCRFRKIVLYLKSFAFSIGRIIIFSIAYYDPIILYTAIPQVLSLCGALDSESFNDDDLKDIYSKLLESSP